MAVEKNLDIQSISLIVPAVWVNKFQMVAQGDMMRIQFLEGLGGSDIVHPRFAVAMTLQDAQELIDGLTETILTHRKAVKDGGKNV